MDKNQGYEIQKAVLFDNGRGMAFGEHPREGFVTWQFTEEAGKRDYYWGHYHSDRAAAEKEFTERGTDYMRRFAVKAAHIEAPGLCDFGTLCPEVIYCHTFLHNWIFTIYALEIYLHQVAFVHISIKLKDAQPLLSGFNVNIDSCIRIVFSMRYSLPCIS